MKALRVKKPKSRPQELKILAFQYFKNAETFKKALKKKKKEKKNKHNQEKKAQDSISAIAVNITNTLRGHFSENKDERSYKDFI